MEAHEVGLQTRSEVLVGATDSCSKNGAQTVKAVHTRSEVAVAARDWKCVTVLQGPEIFLQTRSDVGVAGALWNWKLWQEDTGRHSLSEVAVGAAPSNCDESHWDTNVHTLSEVRVGGIDSNSKGEQVLNGEHTRLEVGVGGALSNWVEGSHAVTFAHSYMSVRYCPEGHTRFAGRQTLSDVTVGRLTWTSVTPLHGALILLHTAAEVGVGSARMYCEQTSQNSHSLKGSVVKHHARGSPSGLRQKLDSRPALG